jgi:hypothetical protein
VFDQSHTLPGVVRELVSVMGKKLTDYVASSKDVGAIDRWIARDRLDTEAELRLRLAYHVVTIRRIHDKPEVVQAWLMGINPDLGDRSAIRMLREDHLDVEGPLLLALRTWSRLSIRRRRGDLIEQESKIIQVLSTSLLTIFGLLLGFVFAMAVGR